MDDFVVLGREQKNSTKLETSLLNIKKLINVHERFNNMNGLMPQNCTLKNISNSTF